MSDHESLVIDDMRITIEDLERENAELKLQIEKMKNCASCHFWLRDQFIPTCKECIENKFKFWRMK